MPASLGPPHHLGRELGDEQGPAAKRRQSVPEVGVAPREEAGDSLAHGSLDQPGALGSGEGVEVQLAVDGG